MTAISDQHLQLDLQLHAWRRGLKTGLYYLRTRAPAYPLPFGVGTLPPPSTARTAEKRSTVFARPADIPTCASCEG